ncbi:hypothetical protein FRX31_022525 [Thalictrum thalictroides]|uniref:Endonuclease/exonuclease/phosphatase domain-containing protein n=1 Tax=Thalictrum thalictroides TaxID=46969 RepID=A0A7J6VTI2_THATH|nr:hypothetical protein FRX31_022525 [Thalictrum thalictroides]
MTILSWNCRGADLDSIIEELKKIMVVERPNFVFVSETKCNLVKAQGILHTLYHFVVPSEGLSGGLRVLWKKYFQMRVVFCDSWIIHCEVRLDNCTWDYADAEFCRDAYRKDYMMVSFVYASPHFVVRKYQWLNFYQFRPPDDVPWLTIGNFNDIVSKDEKVGGCPFNFTKSHFFIDMIDQCELCDLGFIGSFFTWQNKQYGSRRIWKRLDRGMANVAWKFRFPNMKIFHLTTVSSDHKLLILKTGFPQKFRGLHPLFCVRSSDIVF